jgi:hypothetical protein
MLGKAVKLRHCPATVSASATGPSYWAAGWAGNQPGPFPPQRGRSLVNHWKTSSLRARFGKVAGEGASQETGPRAPNPLAFRGERRSYHACFRAIFARHFSTFLSRTFCACFAGFQLWPQRHCPAASIRGVVTDASGAKVTGANVILISNGKVVASAVSTADGSFQI